MRKKNKLTLLQALSQIDKREVVIEGHDRIRVLKMRYSGSLITLFQHLMNEEVYFVPSIFEQKIRFVRLTAKEILAKI